MGRKYSFGRVSAKSKILLCPQAGPLCIEMKVLYVDKKYLKSAVKFFLELNPIAPISELSNEVLRILVA